MIYLKVNGGFHCISYRGYFRALFKLHTYAQATYKKMNQLAKRDLATHTGSVTAGSTLEDTLMGYLSNKMQVLLSTLNCFEYSLKGNEKRHDKAQPYNFLPKLLSQPGTCITLYKWDSFPLNQRC